MGELPVNLGSSTGGVSWTGKDPSVNIQFTQTGVGYDFLKTMNIKVTGRDFSKDYGTDTTNYLINEAAVQRIGYTDPVGKPLTMWGRPGKIIGVMEDFHFQSLHQSIQPLILRLNPVAVRTNIVVRTQPGQTQQALASLESLSRQLNPGFPFTYKFADEEYQKLYKSESVVGSLANYFAFLAIFISCLGLFGLSAFTAEQRTKEIGVRKVLGASVSSIVGLLSKEFLKLVLLAIIISFPLSWWTMTEWLQGFEYKLDLTWWLFALAGILAIGIALLTVSFQSIKAALMNPVKSLRSE